MGALSRIRLPSRVNRSLPSFHPQEERVSRDRAVPSPRVVTPALMFANGFHVRLQGEAEELRGC